MDCPLLSKIEIGKYSLINLDTLRISDLPKLTTLSLGDYAFNDISNLDLRDADEETLLTSTLDCKYKNKSLVLNCIALILIFIKLSLRCFLSILEVSPVFPSFHFISVILPTFL